MSDWAGIALVGSWLIYMTTSTIISIKLIIKLMQRLSAVERELVARRELVLRVQMREDGQLVDLEMEEPLRAAAKAKGTKVH